MEFSKERMEWIEYDLFSSYPEIVQATFLREGGVSKPPFHSLNLSTSVGDNPDSVKVNKDLVHKQFHIPKVVYTKQVHKDKVGVVRKTDKNIEEADALITQDKGVALAATHADCQVAIFFDPITKTIGVAHAGWKGLVLNIYKKTIEAMHKVFQVDPKNLIVGISPSLCKEHAEFSSYKEEFLEEYWSFQEKGFFDLKALGKKQLTEAGVPDGHIEVSDMCTFCNAKECFSYRREKKTGRHATLIGLKPL